MWIAIRDNLIWPQIPDISREQNTYMSYMYYYIYISMYSYMYCNIWLHFININNLIVANLADS